MQVPRERRAEAVGAILRVHGEPRELVVRGAGGARRTDRAHRGRRVRVGPGEPQEEVRGAREGVVRVDLGVEREALLGVEHGDALWVVGRGSARRAEGRTRSMHCWISSGVCARMISYAGGVDDSDI